MTIEADERGIKYWRDIIEDEQHARARAQRLAEECEGRLARVLELIDELAAAVNPLVTAYGQLSALANRLGIYDRAPDVREHVAKRLHSRLGALRPYIPFEHDPDKE